MEGSAGQGLREEQVVEPANVKGVGSGGLRTPSQGGATGSPSHVGIFGVD